MPTKSVHFRFSEKFLKDLDWLRGHSGEMDRTNQLRSLVAEAKARKMEELRQAKQMKKAAKRDG
jgi:hypothetical protein